MFNVNKNRLYLGLLSIFFIGTVFAGSVSAISFTERLEEIGLDIATFSNKKSISRYEIARLLNAANCEDCIQAPDWMKQNYGQIFWDTFKAIDGKDFNDINYGAAVRNKKSYYYCVAYVGDNGYMAGYPSTSTKCQGNFCGQDAITVSEAYQTILNIIQDQIRQKYQINWSNVKSWMNGLTRDRRNTILNQTNIDAINKANSKSTYAQTNDEFQAWLKYCMYNLSGCNFQTFGKIGQAYWPVSELNILYKEGMITAEEAENVYTNPSLNGEDAIRIFGAVFDNYSSCSFNVDYDCDGITNGKDNCPYTYNSNQYDLDGDGIGNVCDDDIDGDGKKNPIGIVDDNNRIIISLWDGEDDKPLGDGELGFSLFINVEAITTGSPAIVRFSTLSSEDIDSIEWDFGDGTKPVVSNGPKASHSYKSNGTFIVRAVAKSKKGGQAFAMTRIFIAAPKSEGYSLNLSSSSTLKNGSIEYTLTPIYSGDLDTISWSVNNNQEKSQKANEKFKVKISENGMYIIDAKGYKNGELKAVSMISFIKNSSPSYANMAIKASNLWEETIITTNVIGINRANIENISINWGGEITNSTNLTQKHIYNEAGLKTIQQTVKLKDGTEYYSIATMNVQNPLLAQSYAINISGKRLAYNQNDKLSLGLSIYPNTPVLSLFTSYQAGQKQFLTSPNLGQVVLNYAYATAGDKKLINSVEVNKCVALINQGTVHINSVDLCEIALKNGTLSKYKCDQDSDGIPDICDDDIDGDGIKNLLGIITRENSDCSISSNNINVDIFKQQFGVCSLDDCPFNSNPDQSDLNNNGIGELCEATTMNLLNSSQISNNGIDVALTIDKDQDQDGISDGRDNCPTIPGNSVNGCPEYYNQNCWSYSTCGNGKVEAGETCLNCPQDVGTCCGNENLESWETCETCPADAGICELCGNGIIDAGENCKSCSKDLKDCTAICGNDVVEDGETCENCSVDVGECTATCGNGKVELAEDCNSCSKDVKQCRNELCGNGRVDVNEQCDNGANNGKDNQCTLMCTKYNPNNPKCGNGVVDDGETCENCSIDLGYRCVINGDYGEKCGNGVVDDGETCENCSVDVGECTATCGNGKVELAEDCGSCPKDVKQCKNELCGNGRVDVNEQCDNGANNGKDNQCTLMCTKYNPNNPKCGNGEIESGENCVTCAVDLGYRCVKDGVVDKCGNGVFDEGETCLNCPKDLGPCTAFCGDGIIQDAETCKNCPADVGKCSATCGNGKIELAEDCNNCPQDVKQCKRELCGNGKIEMIEECDNGENNGKGTCTLMCTKSNPNQPQCGNGVVDEGEDCNNCPVDLGYRCVEDGHFDRCGNGELDPGETCLNCPKDLGPCTAFCGDGIIQDAETCLNCPADVGKCTATCGNGKIELAEDCSSCPKDVKQCRSELCGNGIIDGDEECDSGINNGKPGNQCTVMCVKANPNNPNYGNGDIDPGENCQNASIDLGDKCIDGGDGGYDDFCGDGVIQKGENCRNCSKDVGECTATCGNGKVELAEDCNSCPKDAKQCRNELCGNGRVDANEECDEGKNNGKGACTVMCVKADPNNPNYGNGDIDPGENCQNASIDLGEICIDGGNNDCGNLRVDEGENCTNCSKDVKDPCVIDWKDKCGNGKKDQGETCENCPQDIANCKCGNGIQDEGENCTNCSKDMKDPCVDDRKDKCGNGKIDKGETCETCSKDLKELCMDKNPEINIPNQTEDTCGNGIQDPGEDCTNCPKDFGWCVENNNCNTCPCEYVDFSTDLTKGDSVRAKLWDKSKFVFYRYSNSVSVENYLDLR